MRVSILAQPAFNGSQPRVLVCAGLAFLMLSIAAGNEAGFRQILLGLIGLFAGFALYHASFGFTAAWRRMILERRSLGLRVQLVMLAITILVFFPVLHVGQIGGQLVSGFVNPIGWALALGAFLFGIGMQLGGGCGSGTLFTVGGGNTRMVVTLLAFITGSVIATADPLGWMAWPSIGGYSLLESLGLVPALITAFSLLALCFVTVRKIEFSKYGEFQPITIKPDASFLTGPWPLITGGLALALINIATLLVAGRPWGITTAFALWGAKFIQVAGINVSLWPYWQGDSALSANLFSDVTTVMNLGIMLGALIAAGLAGKFAPQTRIPLASLVAAVLGGLLMGFGARLATGCNIGAFFSGTASGSLHGVLWLLFAIPGNVIGVWLRPQFQLD